jgi:RNA polymerase sigma factor (sigma-70 family)
VETSTSEKLLTIDGTFFQTVSLRLADRAAGMGVPPSEIEDVVAEVWLEVVKHYCQFADGVVEWQFQGWLLQVLHSKAVDALRRLNRHPCESLGGREELIDDMETKRAEAAEWGEWLTVQLDKVGVGKEDNLRLLCAHFYQERPIHDLAQQFGMTPDAIDCRIRRLLRNLRNLEE